MKSNNKWRYITPSLLVILIGRYISSKYGGEANEKFTITILELVIMGLMVLIVYYTLKKHYGITMGLVAFLIPFIMCAIGLYINNLTLFYVGLVLVLIVFISVCIIVKIMCKNKNK
ncbi:hypothetical protein [Clostridium sp. UBA7503]|uniref:hypothetical protein n=1 Tax=Clostridium sp. UBA7503 TaxID=1946377 RepID=UPI0032173CED